MLTNNYPYVYLFSEYNFLGLELARKLKLLGLRVITVSDSIDEWNRQMNLEVLSYELKNPLNGFQNREPDYIIFISNTCFLNENNAEMDREDEKLSIIRNLSVESRAKTLYVFPYKQSESVIIRNSKLIDDIFVKDLSHSSVNMIADIIPNAEKKDEWSVFNDLLMQISKTATIPTYPIYYPISANEIVNILIKNLFSLSSYSKRTAVLGGVFKSSDLSRVLKNNNISVILDNQQDNLIKEAVIDAKIYGTEKPNLLINNFIKENIKNVTPILQTKLTPTISKTHNKKTRVFLNSIFHKPDILKRRTFPVNLIKKQWKLALLAIIILILTYPIICTLIGKLLLTVSENTLVTGNLTVAEKLLTVDSILLKSSEKYTSVVANIEPLSNPYDTLSLAAHIQSEEAEAGIKIINIIKYFINTADNLQTNYNLDINELSSKLSLELNSLYENLGFVESDIQNTDGFTKKLIYLPNPESIKELRTVSHQLSKVTSALPALMGAGSPKSYMILLSNSYFLRPSGGVYPSFAIITLSDGKILKIENFKSQDVDVKLNGNVDPPQPLKKYFNQKSWYLTDAGWDPDFSAAATQAEWFLDKEENIKVDGVIAIDKTPFTSMLRSSTSVIEENNSLKLTDILTTPTSQDYPRVGDSEPFSYFDDLFNQTQEPKSEKDKFDIFKNILSFLETKQIQIFIHDPSAQKALSDLAWDGSITNTKCPNNCNSDLIGLFETSNTKQDNSILKEGQLSLSLQEKVIKHEFRFFIQNNSEEVYKSYLKLVVPADSGFSPIKVYTQSLVNEYPPEVTGVRGVKEGGIFVEVGKGETKAIQFTWEEGLNSDFGHEGSFNFSLIKQAGGYPFKIDIKVDLPKTLKLSDIGIFTLTDDYRLTYNTVLDRNIKFNIGWK